MMAEGGSARLGGFARAGSSGDPVELCLPPEAEYLRLARYAAADASTRAGLALDDTDDVRLAVSELCSLLTGSGVPIRLRFEAVDGAVVVSGQGMPRSDIEGENGELARILAEAVVDEFRFEVLDGEASFRIEKRRGGEGSRDEGGRRPRRGRSSSGR